jgi:hypothetical protein
MTLIYAYNFEIGVQTKSMYPIGQAGKAFAGPGPAYGVLFLRMDSDAPPRSSNICSIPNFLAKKKSFPSSCLHTFTGFYDLIPKSDLRGVVLSFL